MWLDDGRVYVTLPDGSIWYPSLMDVQNTLCEFGKYVKHMGRGGNDTKKPYKGSGSTPLPVYPAHWKGTE